DRVAAAARARRAGATVLAGESPRSTAARQNRRHQSTSQANPTHVAIVGAYTSRPQAASRVAVAARYGTAASGTRRLVAFTSPLTSPSKTLTGMGGVILKR